MNEQFQFSVVMTLNMCWLLQWIYCGFWFLQSGTLSLWFLTNIIQLIQSKAVWLKLISTLLNIWNEIVAVIWNCCFYSNGFLLVFLILAEANWRTTTTCPSTKVSSRSRQTWSSWSRVCRQPATWGSCDSPVLFAWKTDPDDKCSEDPKRIIWY